MHFQKLGPSVHHIHPNYLLFESKATRGHSREKSHIFPQDSLYTRKYKIFLNFQKKNSLFFLFQKLWKKVSSPPHLTCAMSSLWELRCPNQGKKRTKKREREEKKEYTLGEGRGIHWRNTKMVKHGVICVMQMHGYTKYNCVHCLCLLKLITQVLKSTTCGLHLSQHSYIISIIWPTTTKFLLKWLS